MIRRSYPTISCRTKVRDSACLGVCCCAQIQVRRSEPPCPCTGWRRVFTDLDQCQLTKAVFRAPGKERNASVAHNLLFEADYLPHHFVLTARTTIELTTGIGKARRLGPGRVDAAVFVELGASSTTARDFLYIGSRRNVPTVIGAVTFFGSYTVSTVQFFINLWKQYMQGTNLLMLS